MNSRFREVSILRTAKRIPGLARLVALALICAGPTYAQSKPAQTDSPTSPPTATAPRTPPIVQPSAAVAQTRGATQETTLPVAQNSSATPPVPKGQPEGITVHGHWTIDVRNPDGSTVRHVEFENSLDPGFSVPAATATFPVPGGVQLLLSMLNGTASPSLGNWGIMLVGPSGLTNLANTANAPCIATLLAFTSNGSQFTNPLDACVLFPSPTSTTSTPPTLGFLVTNNPCTTNPPGPPGISCNVVSAFTGPAGGSTGFQISGSVTASQTGQIATVATVNFDPCANLPDPIFCTVGFLTPMVSLTSSTNFPGAPINVTAGQSVAVTVSISFH
jgi:hypothetical protein